MIQEIDRYKEAEQKEGAVVSQIDESQFDAISRHQQRDAVPLKMIRRDLVNVASGEAVTDDLIWNGNLRRDHFFFVIFSEVISDKTSFISAIFSDYNPIHPTDRTLILLQIRGNQNRIKLRFVDL